MQRGSYSVYEPSFQRRIPSMQSEILFLYFVYQKVYRLFWETV